ncbi:MAG TPA: hypothetical protein VLA92_02465 [Candidatus Saccharimonadales bacterium]|nr:hypothetical protein [Candidatus Saccharimonadales bacterium]
MLSNDQVLQTKIGDFLRRKQAKFPELASTDIGDKEGRDRFKGSLQPRGLRFAHK